MRKIRKSRSEPCSLTQHQKGGAIGDGGGVEVAPRERLHASERERSSTRPSDQREEEKKAVTFLTSLLCEARLGLGQGTLT